MHVPHACASGGTRAAGAHSAEVAAAEVVLEGEVEGAALRLVGKVVREGVEAEEADEGVELVDAVLQRRAGEAPPVARRQRKRGLRRVAAPVLDAVGLVEHHPPPPDLHAQHSTSAAARAPCTRAHAAPCHLPPRASAAEGTASHGGVTASSGFCNGLARRSVTTQFALRCVLQQDRRAPLQHSSQRACSGVC